MRVLLSGDALITRPYAPVADPALLNLLLATDVRFTNLEMLLNHYEGTPAVECGGLHLSAAPEIGRDLLDTGFNLFANANNHSLDSGSDGLELHIEIMQQLGMVYAGVGASLGEAAAPGYLQTSAGRAALISCASSFAKGQRAGEYRADFRARPGLNPQRFDTKYELTDEQFEQLRRVSRDLGIEEMYRWAVDMQFRKALDDEANQQRWGENMLFERAETTGITTTPNKTDLDRNLSSIKHARRQADLVIVSIHAHESDIVVEKPAHFIGEFARACIDAGADIVTGSGPHMMRGIELYNGKPIFYSLGNLWFQYETVDRLPADSYEYHQLETQALSPADLYDEAMLGFQKDARYWECAMPVCTFEDGKLTQLTLHPATLGHGTPRGRRGTPRMADQDAAARILGYVQELSEPYGTRIRAGDGMGVVELA